MLCITALCVAGLNTLQRLQTADDDDDDVARRTVANHNTSIQGVFQDNSENIFDI